MGAARVREEDEGAGRAGRVAHDDGVAGVCEHTPRPSYTCKQVEMELGAHERA